MPAGDFAAWATTPNVSVLVGDFNGDRRDDVALTGPSGWGSIPVAFSGNRLVCTPGGITCGLSYPWDVKNKPIADFAAWSATRQ